MGLLDLIKSLLIQYKKIDLKKLPSQGIFYRSDFEMKIKKADLEDIIDYELNFNKENLYSVIEAIKKVVKKNCYLPANYKFEDIKSVDIVFIFLEIVKFTMNKEIIITYTNDVGVTERLLFDNKYFNYYDFSKFERKEDTAEIIMSGYKVSMPSIGIENCLTQFLVNRSFDKDAKKWNDYSYDFLFFCGNKNYLSDSEIENLVTIFNFDMDSAEQKKVSKIVNKFMKVVGYTLKIDGKVIEIKSKIDLEKIWKDQKIN